MMIARWHINARFGHKQQAIDLLKRWDREIGPKAGIAAGSQQILTGSLGAKEAEIQSDMRIGSLAELVVPDRTGLQFRAGDASELAARVRELWADDVRRERLRRGARARFDAEYTASRNLGLLLDVYAAAGAARG